jgi:hydroxymethylbilane synthase
MDWRKKSKLVVGARASRLSQAQVQEIARLLPSVTFDVRLVETVGDRDQKTSLRTLDKTNFFTKELDEMLLSGVCRVAIHSAKDLPEPLPQGIVMIALTEGLDASDVLVFNGPLPYGAKIGTSCERREKAVKAFRPDLQCVDIRGTIEHRLKVLDEKKLDGLVVAEAALIRLGLQERQRITLEGETASLQGKLAVLAREGDVEMGVLFAPFDIRNRNVLYLGLDPSQHVCWGKVTHYPIIRVVPRPFIAMDISSFTHIIFTSKTAVQLFNYSITNQTLISIGKVTAAHLEVKGIAAHYVAHEETQEGIVALLKDLDLTNSRLLLPRSARARSHLTDYLTERKVAHVVLDLYDTVVADVTLPDLSCFDEVVFTSPSTVEAFFEKVDLIPSQVRLRAIGPVTTNALQIMMSIGMNY